MLLPPRGLQRRIMSYVALGLLALFGLFAALTWRAIQDSSALIAEQRLSLAQSLAVYLDSSLSRALLHVEGASFTLGLLGDRPGALAAFLAQLRQHLYDHGVEVPSCLSVVDAAGQVLRTEVGSGAGACAPPAAQGLAARALATAGLVQEPLTAPPGDERPLLSVAIPMSAAPGGAVSVLVADLRPTLHGADLRSFLREAEAERGYRIEILAEGRAVDTSVPEPPEYAAAHWRLIAPRLREGQAGLVEHVVTDAAGKPIRSKRHFVAFVPLRTAPWVVVVEQADDLALALPRALRNQMLAAAALGLVAALAMAWLTTRQVIRPLNELAAAAQRIARGDLEQAIGPSGHDEVHLLGITLEEMRQRLQALLAEREEWGHELERQVLARTRELEQRNRELAAAGEENRRLYEQVLDKEQQRRRLLERIMMAYEEERKRVARELHDEVGQALTGLIVTLDGLAGRGSRARGQRQALQGVRELTNATLGEVRRVIAALRPSLLDDLGLVPAIHWLAKSTLGAAGVDYRVEASSLNGRLPAPVETALFRIAQEAITNVVRHARARRVSILLHTTATHAEVVVEDDGTGFDAGAADASGRGDGAQLHVGLLGMRERAELLGGQLELVSAPGRGTRVRARIPIGTCAETGV